MILNWVMLPLSFELLGRLSLFLAALDEDSLNLMESHKEGLLRLCSTLLGKELIKDL